MRQIRARILLVASLITRMSIRSARRNTSFAAVLAAAFPSSQNVLKMRSVNALTFNKLPPPGVSLAAWHRQIQRSMTNMNQEVIPRAAVSVVVRVSCLLYDGTDQATNTKFYLLIQRGTDPNKGIWSLPGGKIDYGETTFEAAQRELNEETKWSDLSLDALDIRTPFSKLRWWRETVTTTDAIGDGYHYLIAHCFAEYPSIEIRQNHPLEGAISSLDYCRKLLPMVQGADDAADAQWLTFLQIQEMESIHRNVTSGIVRVIQRVEDLDAVSPPTLA